jgi:hypothetical protein
MKNLILSFSILVTLTILGCTKEVIKPEQPLAKPVLKMVMPPSAQPPVILVKN